MKTSLQKLSLNAISTLALGLAFSLTLSACAPKSNGPSSDDLADMTSELGAAADETGALPKALGGEGLKPAPKAKPIDLPPAQITLVNNQKFAVDECFTFSVGQMARHSSAYSISGNYDGLRYQAELQKVITEMDKDCKIEGEHAEVLTQYFTPLHKYIDAMNAKTGVKESNKVNAYLKQYYNIFDMAE